MYKCFLWYFSIISSLLSLLHVKMIQESIVSIVLGCRLDDPGYESQQMQKIFLFSKMYKFDLGPI